MLYESLTFKIGWVCSMYIPCVLSRHLSGLLKLDTALNHSLKVDNKAIIEVFDSLFWGGQRC